MKLKLLIMVSCLMIVSSTEAFKIDVKKELADMNVEKEEGNTMEPNIGIEKQQRKDSANMLNALLAEEFVLYVKTLNYHWNVQGVHFASLHEFFKISYEELLTICDDVAERARALGEPAGATMKEFLNNSTLKEEAGRVPSELEMLKNLLHDHEEIIRIIRIGQQLALNKYNDIGTNNFLCNLIEKHEKRAWMLRAFLNSTSPH